MFFSSLFTLLAVMMVYKYWDSITKEDLEFAVSNHCLAAGGSSQHSQFILYNNKEKNMNGDPTLPLSPSAAAFDSKKFN